jgi:hypothetical protein
VAENRAEWPRSARIGAARTPRGKWENQPGVIFDIERSTISKTGPQCAGSITPIGGSMRTWYGPWPQ